MQHIRILIPIVHKEGDPQVYAGLLRKHCPDLAVEISCAYITHGPTSIESEAQERQAVPGLIALAEQAQQEGVDGLIVDCMGDPGVEELRMHVSIPVMGPERTCLHWASMQTDRIAIIASSAALVPLFWNDITRLGFKKEHFTVCCINVAVLDIASKRDAVLDALFTEIMRVVDEEGVEQVVLGCTAFTELAHDLAQRLKAAGCRAGLIIPVPCTLKLMANLFTSDS